MAAIDRFLSLMDRLEAKYARRIGSVLEEGYLGMAAAFRTSRLPGPPPEQTLPKLKSALGLLWAESIEEGSAAFLAEYRDGFPAQTKASELVRGLIETFVSSLRPNVAQQILDTSRRQIRDMMAGGLSSGQSADAVYADILEKMPEIASVRGLLISRTEVHAATQFSAWQLARRSSIPLVKVWSSVSDERTRDFGELGKISAFNHRTMDGVRASINDAFLVPRIIGGYEPLMFPGDPRGSAGNVINCRCIQTYERA